MKSEAQALKKQQNKNNSSVFNQEIKTPDIVLIDSILKQLDDVVDNEFNENCNIKLINKNSENLKSNKDKLIMYSSSGLSYIADLNGIDTIKNTTELSNIINCYHDIILNKETLEKIKSSIEELQTREITSGYFLIIDKLFNKIKQTTSVKLLKELITLYSITKCDNTILKNIKDNYINEITTYIIHLLFTDIKKYISFFDNYSKYIPEKNKNSSDTKTKYNLLKKYLVSFPTNKKEVNELFIFTQYPSLNNLKYIFFAPRKELLTLREYGKLYAVISILTDNEKHLINQFIDDNTIDYSKNIGPKLFSENYYFEDISIECKKFIDQQYSE